MRARKRMMLSAICLAIACQTIGGCARNQPQVTYPYSQTVAPAAGVPAQAAVVPQPAAPQPARKPLPNIRRPQWRSPGTIAEQRREAQIFDPYGSVDAGPEIVGGRPRDFQRPIAEPARATTFPRRHLLGHA